MTMNSGGAYYNTAVGLRDMAKKARESYPGALERAGLPGAIIGDKMHPDNLVAQTVGFEIAAALWGIAQAIEDFSS